MPESLHTQVGQNYDQHMLHDDASLCSLFSNIDSPPAFFVVSHFRYDCARMRPAHVKLVIAFRGLSLDCAQQANAMSMSPSTHALVLPCRGFIGHILHAQKHPADDAPTGLVHIGRSTLVLRERWRHDRRHAGAVRPQRLTTCRPPGRCANTHQQCQTALPAVVVGRGSEGALCIAHSHPCSPAHHTGSVACHRASVMQIGIPTRTR